MRKYLTASSCFLVFAAVAVLATPEAWQLDRPVTHDHAIHYASAWQLIHRMIHQDFDFSMLPRIIWGWNDSWAAGAPVGYVYPVLASWLVAALHGIFTVLSFGQLPLGFAYAVAIILAHFLEGHSLYALGRTMGYPKAGFLAGLVFMTQVGAPFIGGWHWTHYVGVWPVSLSVSLSIYACAAFFRLTVAPGPRTAGIFGLLWGGALLAHPLQMIHFVVMVPAMLVAIFWRCGAGRIQAARWLLAGSVVAAGIGALWIVPFLSVTAYAEQEFFLLWKPLTDLLREMVTGKIYPGLLPAIQIVGLAGIVLAFLRGNPAMLAIALTCLVLVVTGSKSFYDALSLGGLGRPFKIIQYIRFQAILRPYWCLAGAVFLIPFASSIFRRHGTLIVTTLFVVACVPDAWNALFLKRALHPWPRRHADYEAVVSWLRDVEASDQGFFRVAVFNKPNDPWSHELTELVTRVRSPVIAANYHPTLNFRSLARTQTAETLKLLSIRYLISETENPGVLDFVTWQFRQRAGRYFIYENNLWSPERVSMRTLDGQPAQNSLVREMSPDSFADRDGLYAEVSPGTRGFVWFHTSWFPRWHATWTGRGGDHREIEVRPLRLTRDVELISVAIPEDGGGRIHLRFVHGWPEYAGMAIFLVAMGAALALVFHVPVSRAARRSRSVRGS